MKLMSPAMTIVDLDIEEVMKDMRKQPREMQNLFFYRAIASAPEVLSEPEGMIFYGRSPGPGAKDPNQPIELFCLPNNMKLNSSQAKQLYREYSARI